MSERKAFRDAILADEEVQRLLERFTMAVRFHAVFVTCEMPRVANALVEILDTELPRLREETMRIVRLDPYRAHKDILAPIPVDLLIDEVLAKVVHPPAENQGSSVLTVVDASRSLPQDDGPWSIVFQRMNERRNAIMRALPGPFLIVGPKRYAGLFGLAAPDFWSIVGAIVDVPTPEFEEEWRTIFGAEERSMDPNPFLIMMSSMVGISLSDNAIAEAERALEGARQHFAKYSNDPGAATLVAAQLIRLGALSGSSSRSNAIALLDEAIDILPTKTNQKNDPVAAVLASHAFLFRGFLHFADQRFTHALVDVEQSTKWARCAVSLQPESIEFSTHLASNLLTLGILHLEMGKADAAIESFAESISHFRNLIAEVEDVTDVLGALAMNLDNLGDAYRAKRDLGRALFHYEEAAKTSQQALQRNSHDTKASRHLALALHSASRIQMVRGDYDRSVRLAEHALNATRQWMDLAEAESDTESTAMKLVAAIRAQLAQINALPSPPNDTP